jgi:DNA-binding NarL/FixJ family response regulator
MGTESPRVLLVDDSKAMLAWTKSVLTPHCTVVGAVASGAAALEVVSVLQPEIVVTDISMPGMTGFELAFRLRQAGSRAALVFLTIHEEEEFIQAALDAGASGYVIKRKLPADLLEAVRAARAHRQFVSSVR